MLCENQILKNLTIFCRYTLGTVLSSDFIWPFLRPYMGVIPNPKMAYIFPISCILALIFPILLKYFPKYEGKGSFLIFQIKSLLRLVKAYNPVSNLKFMHACSNQHACMHVHPYTYNIHACTDTCNDQLLLSSV